MARLQILELPEGTNDDRPPFILVIDQYVARRYVTGLDQSEPIDEFDGIAEKVGARAVLVFEETIDIPANDTSAYLAPPAGKQDLVVKLGDQDVRAAIAADMQKMRDANDTATDVRDKDAELRAANEALERVRLLHQPVEHGGQTICWACSDYDFPGQTTDSPPVAYDQCGTLRALDGEQRKP